MQTEIQLPLPGTPCRHIVRLLTARLRDVPGVVTVEMAAGVVVVTGRMSRAAVSEAFADARGRARHLPDCPATP